jgi:hypothetical protein
LNHLGFEALRCVDLLLYIADWINQTDTQPVAALVGSNLAVDHRSAGRAGICSTENLEITHSNASNFNFGASPSVLADQSVRRVPSFRVRG